MKVVQKIDLEDDVLPIHAEVVKYLTSGGKPFGFRVSVGGSDGLSFKGRCRSHGEALKSIDRVVSQVLAVSARAMALFDEAQAVPAE
jgi:hypothetical protein